MVECLIAVARSGSVLRVANHMTNPFGGFIDRDERFGSSIGARPKARFQKPAMLKPAIVGAHELYQYGDKCITVGNKLAGRGFAADQHRHRREFQGGVQSRHRLFDLFERDTKAGGKSFNKVKCLAVGFAQ